MGRHTPIETFHSWMTHSIRVPRSLVRRRPDRGAATVRGSGGWRQGTSRRRRAVGARVAVGGAFRASGAGAPVGVVGGGRLQRSGDEFAAQVRGRHFAVGRDGGAVCKRVGHRRCDPPTAGGAGGKGAPGDAVGAGAEPDGGRRGGDRPGRGRCRLSGGLRAAGSYSPTFAAATGARHRLDGAARGQCESGAVAPAG
eukprot:ctg_299.g162